MPPAPVSAVIKAKNESRQIIACFESLKDFVSEVILVDDASTDDTAALAKAWGARVISAKSEDGMIDVLDKIGFEAASQPWIIRLDADERLTPSLAEKLREVIAEDRVNGVRFARKNYMFGAWARHGGWFTNDQVRLFRASAWDRSWDAEKLHTQVPVAEPLLTLPREAAFSTDHFDYDSVEEYVRRTLWRYGISEAVHAQHAGRRFSGSRLLWRPLKRFVGRLTFRQGFRDGWRGVILAGMLAAYDFCIEANLWDLERQRRENDSPGSPQG